jgi:hypothetical protein
LLTLLRLDPIIHVIGKMTGKSITFLSIIFL